MPFSFYRVPNMTIIFKNYDPVTYVQHMVDLYAVASSNELLRQRLMCSANALVRCLHFMRTAIAKRRHKAFRRILNRFKSDSHFLAFHCGETDVLPAHYARAYHRTMGAYAELVPVGESYPLAR
jgi:hypothetical protein